MERAQRVEPVELGPSFHVFGSEGADAIRYAREMPGTFSNVLLHIVFSTKKRAPLITSAVQPRLYKFVGGIVRNEGGMLLEIGGIEDHAHLLVRWKTEESIAYLLRNIKARSSKWVNENRLISSRFAWQEGYSVFSVSKSQSARVASYIQRQEQHHRRQSFQDELLKLLRKNDVEFDPRYVFD